MKKADRYPNVEIFILNTNAKTEVRKILKKLQLLKYPRAKFSITICDNNSTDGSKEMFQNEFPNINVIALQKNHGMSALNYGFRQGHTQYCFILDDDSYFEPEAIIKAIDEFRKDHDLGIIACNIINPLDGSSEFKYLLPKTKNSIFWNDFIGGGCVIKRDVFDKVGYFSPDILIYGHEADFSLRALDAGFHIRYASEIHVYRLTEPNTMNEFRMSLGVRNFPMVFWRYLFWWHALSMTLIIWSEYLLLALSTHTTAAYFRGIKRFFSEFPKIFLNRHTVKLSTQKFWTSVYPFTPKNTIRRFFRRYNFTS